MLLCRALRAVAQALAQAARVRQHHLRRILGMQGERAPERREAAGVDGVGEGEVGEAERRGGDRSPAPRLQRGRLEEHRERDLLRY